MKVKTIKAKKLLSLILALAMMATIVLPTSVFAATPVVSNVVASVNKGTGTDLVKTITIGFDSEITFDDTDFTTNVTLSDSHTFGTGATANLSDDEKAVVITLGTGADVVIGDTITFANDVIASAAVPTDVYNGDTSVITGSLTPATVDFDAPAGVTVTVEGAIPPAEYGVGTYSYKAEGTGFTTVEKDFEIVAADLGSATPKVITVPAKEIGNVGFTAVAVSSDVAKNYGKADSVVVVFSEAIDATDAEMLTQFNNSAFTAAEWVGSTKTVLKLTLADNHTLINGDDIEYKMSSEVETVLGKVVPDYATTIEGNLEGSADKLVATVMTATIVNKDMTPGVATGDKIVLVFNAPVEGKPSPLEVTTSEGEKLTATPVGTTGTIYEIADFTGKKMNDGIKLTCGSMADVALMGSFGTAVAPKVLKAVAVDNDGTALTEGDSVIVYFDRNTNKSTTGTLAGNLAGATYEWIDAQTLKITLDEAKISNTDKIDISAIAIKDCYNKIDAEGLKDIAIEGGFGHAIKPEISRVSAVSVTGNPTAAQGDKIVVAFNTVVDHSEVTDISVTGGNLGNGFTVDWNDNETTVAIITLGAGSPKVDVGTTAIRFDGAIWDTTHSLKLTNQDYTVSHGAWGITITPELMSATIVKVSDKPTAQAGDKIVFVFTTSTNSPANITAMFGDKLGTGATGEWTAEGTIYTLTLGTNPTIVDGSEITFTNNNGVVKDYYGISQVANKSGIALKGSFGKANRPELLSATIVKNAIEPKAQVGDQIALVFSAMTNEKADIVSLFGNKFGTNATGVWSTNGTVYTITLGTNPTITDSDKITLTENSGFMDVHEVETVKGGTAISLTGTFGEEVVQNLQVSSVIAYSEGSKNKIKVIFNVETNLPTVANASFKTALGEANKVGENCIFGEDFTIDVTAQELIITLDTTGYTITDATVLNLAGLGIESISGGALTGTIPACDGYFVPVVTDAEVLDDGVTVAIYFSARTDGNLVAAKSAVQAQKALFGTDAYNNVEWKNNNTELHITMSDDNTMANDAYIVLNDFEIYDEFSKTHKVVGQYKVDTEKLDYKTLTFIVYANALNTENAAREDVTKALDGDELVIEFNRATNKPADMITNLSLENADDKFGEGATAVWATDKKLVVTLGTGSVVTTSSKIIVKNVKFANNTGKLSQTDANTSEATAITGKFDGREYWVDSATKAVANGRTRITVALTKSAIATEATNVFAICQAYNSKNTVETISAIGVPDKATNSFIFDFNATNLTDFEVFVLKGDYSDMNAGVDVYSDTIKPTTAE